MCGIRRMQAFPGSQRCLPALKPHRFGRRLVRFVPEGHWRCGRHSAVAGVTSQDTALRFQSRARQCDAGSKHFWSSENSDAPWGLSGTQVEGAAGYDGCMQVKSKLRLRVGAIRIRRVLLIAVSAAALIWFFPGHVGMSQPLGMLTLSLILAVGIVFLLRKPSPRCPRCAHRMALRRGVKACPTCNVSLDAEVEREWSLPPTIQSPWVMRSGTLRTE